MKRTIFSVILLILLFFAVPLGASAAEYDYDLGEDTDIFSELYAAVIPDDLEESLPDDVRRFIYEYDLSPRDPQSFSEIFSADGLSGIFSRLLDYILSPIKTAAVIMTAILLCSLLYSLRTKEQTSSVGALSSFSALVCAALIISPVTLLITDCVNVLTALSAFMTALIPVYAGLLIAAAKAGTALGFQSAVFLATETVGYIASYIVSPFSAMYLALSAAGGVSGESRLIGVGEIVKKTAMWTMSISMTVYMAVFSIKNIISTTADSAGAKTARFLITSFVPIVGASVNEALGSMKGCLDLLCRSFGIYAVIIMLAVMLPLLIRLIVWRLVLSLCGAAADMFGTESVSALIKATSCAIMILLSVVICSGVMFIFSVTVLTNAAAG